MDCRASVLGLTRFDINKRNRASFSCLLGLTRFNAGVLGLTSLSCLFRSFILFLLSGIFLSLLYIIEQMSSLVKSDSPIKVFLLPYRYNRVVEFGWL